LLKQQPLLIYKRLYIYIRSSQTYTTMKNLLISILCVITMGSHAQTIKPDYIKKLEKIFERRQVPYWLSFNDSIKIKHPYLTHGKSLGILTVKNSKYPTCALKYYVYQYTDKDSIAHDILRFYSIREDFIHLNGPYKPIFYMDKYVFFNKGWRSDSDLVNEDDVVKYMSIRIADDMDMYMKYDKYKY
jgi:hypothetical protein